MRLVAILGGGDWADASVDHMALPDGMDPEAMRAKYEDWYRNSYCAGPSDPNRGLLQPPSCRYMTFPEFLISRGARYTTEAELEVYEY